jgi:hypothetical protein
MLAGAGVSGNGVGGTDTGTRVAVKAAGGLHAESRKIKPKNIKRKVFK